ncbi:DUF4271 domain-containing protein [Bacteroidales bacterium OttesenSCG-928-A17]|nr:DUF4271 domain-containing protein [Bacteroidales bacterium OttesenSCG-928-A17]
MNSISETDMMELPLQGNNEITNWVFVLFLVCFFINVFIVVRKLPLVFSMMDGLLHKKERQSIFYIQGNSGFSENFSMLTQSVLLLGVVSFCSRRYLSPDLFQDAPAVFLYLGKGILLFVSFFIYKYATYNLIGFSFFSKEQSQLWNSHFMAILCLIGVVLFVPALLFFFVSQLSIFCFWLLVLLGFFVFLLVVYTLFRIFFQDKVPLLYFILYLCAQEIAPLYVLYKGFVYFL